MRHPFVTPGIVLTALVVLAGFTSGTGLSAGPAPGSTGADDLRTGHLLVANQQAASASLIDLATDEMRLIEVGTGPHEAAISPSGLTGVVTVYGLQTPGRTLAVIDIRTGRVTKTIDLGRYTRPHGVVFLPGDDDRVVVTSETTRMLVQVNLRAGEVERAVPTNAAASHMAGVTRDGRRAYTANIVDGSVTEIDLVAGTTGRIFKVGPRSEGIAVAPDGRTVWAGSNTEGTVSVVDTVRGEVVKTLTGFVLPYRLAISPDGATAIVCDPEGNRIHVISTSTREVAWTLDDLPSPRGVTIAPDGRTAFVTLAGDPSVGVVDLVGRRLTRTIGVGASPDGVGYGVALAGTRY
ncbi:MAG: hypothetical protein R2752_18150 [Vicinamibacterales bacterium]